MRVHVNTVKTIILVVTIAASVIIPRGAAFGIVGQDVREALTLISVPNAQSRAASDIRVRRLKQMFNANQITPEDYFESVQSESAARETEAGPQE